MGLFSNFTNDSFDEQKDTLGGFTLLDSDIYDATLKFVYANRAPSGAVSINIIADIEGTEYREIIYITNKNGENFYYSKANTSKKMPLPGFVTINDICTICCQKPLSQMETENKIANIYDPTLKKEVPTSVPALLSLCGKKIKFGILKEKRFKVESTDNGYVDTEEVQERNVINKVFNPETKQTVYEMNHNLIDPPLFADKWLEKNGGMVIDHTTKSTGNKRSSGKPVPPKKEEHKSLFNN